MIFTLDRDLTKLDWHGRGEEKPVLDKEEAMIIAVASIASAIENVAAQLHFATEALQEAVSKMRDQNPL